MYHRMQELGRTNAVLYCIMQLLYTLINIVQRRINYPLTMNLYQCPAMHLVNLRRPWDSDLYVYYHHCSLATSY